MDISPELIHLWSVLRKSSASLVVRETQEETITQDPTSHPLGWLYSEGQTVTSSGEDVEKSEASYTMECKMVRMWSMATTENSLAVPQKVKNRVTI